MFSINNNFVDEFERRMLKTMRDELATLGLDNGPTVDSLPMLGGPTGGPVLALTGSKALTNIGGRALAGFGAVDYVEMDDKFHIVGDFPGCKKADVDVKVDGNLLTITAERKWCHREVCRCIICAYILPLYSVLSYTSRSLYVSHSTSIYVPI